MVDRETIDRVLAEAQTRPRRRRWSKARCGTVGGWYRHRRNYQEPCGQCWDVYRAHRREKETQRRRRLGQKPFRAARCGTTGGYQRHRDRGETTCQPCRDAHAAYGKRYRYGG